MAYNYGLQQALGLPSDACDLYNQYSLIPTKITMIPWSVKVKNQLNGL